MALEAEGRGSLFLLIQAEAVSRLGLIQALGAHMGFRFQRRINLGGGWGLNTSGSGGSLSRRTRHGSIGTKGFSLRTGIPGLSFRQSWGKNSGAAAAIAILVMAVVAAAVQLLVLVIPLIWQCLTWLALTIYDFGVYCVQAFKKWRARSSG